MPASNLEINLLDHSDINTRPLGKFLKWSLTYGRYIIIGTQVIVLLAFFSRFRFDQELSDLHTRIDEKVNIIQALSSIETNTRAVQNRLSLVKTLEESRSLYTLVLNNLANEVAVDTSITQISIVENKITINGLSLNNTSFSKFLNIVRKSTLFFQISLNDISKSSVDGTISFSMSMEVVSEKPAEQINNIPF